MRFKMAITILGLLVGHVLAMTTTEEALCANLAEKIEEELEAKALLLMVLKASNTGLYAIREEIRQEMNIMKEDIFTKISELNQTLNSPNPVLTVPNGCANWNRPADTTMILPQENLTYVSTTQGLHNALRDSVKGTVIHLSEGVYTGPFAILEHNITLRGSGPRTIITLDVNNTTKIHNKVALKILGDKCKVHSLKVLTCQHGTTGIRVSGHGVNLSHVRIEGFSTAVRTRTDDNTFTNISLKNGEDGFLISGKRNQLTNITLLDMAARAVQLAGDNNSVSHLTCARCSRGIEFAGNGNRVQQVEMRDSKSETWGIYISSGDGNFVDFFRSVGNYLQMHGSNAEIRNSVFRKAEVFGRGHTLFNVDIGRMLYIFQGGHRIENSKAGRLYNNGEHNTKIIQSSFVY